MAKKLTDLEIVEASGVDHPAHLHEGWLLMKSLDEVLDEADSLMSDVDSTDDTGGITVSEETSVEQPETIDEAPEATEPETVDASETSVDVVEREPVMASADDGVPEAIAKQIDDLRKRATDAETLAKALQHERAVEKATDRVAGWSYLPQMTEEFTKTLVSLRHDSPTEAEAVEKVLDAANALLSENMTMAQIGSDGESATDSAWEQINSLAKAAVSDGQFKSYTDALQSVTVANPSLYEQHRVETGNA